MAGDSRPDPFIINPSDVPPDGASDLRDTDTPPNRCNYPGCTDAVVRTGKGGRPPKYCPTHKDNRSRNKGTTTGGRSAVSGKAWARAVEVETILCKYVAGLGWGIQLVNPVDGKVVADNGPAVIHELVELAKTDTRLRKPLEFAATPGKYGPLLLALLAVIAPILANHGLLPQFQIPGLTPGIASGGE